MHQTLEEAAKSELGKKAGQVGGEFASQAKQMGEQIRQKTSHLGETQTANVVRKGVQHIKEEVEGSTLAGPQLYRPPLKLRRRDEYSVFSDDRPVEPNT